MNTRCFTFCVMFCLITAFLRTAGAEQGKSPPPAVNTSDIRGIQTVIAEGQLSFRLPSTWIANPDNEQTKSGGIYMYGRPMQDRNGRPIVPACTFVFLETDSTDVVKLFANTLAQSSLTTTERVFTSDDGFLSIENAVGIKGSLRVTPESTRDVIIVGALDTTKRLFVQAVCEAPQEIFGAMERDFLFLLKTMQFTK
jgi:hypothetical protein